MRHICSLCDYQYCFRFVMVHLKFVAYHPGFDITYAFLHVVDGSTDGLLELCIWVLSAYSWCDTGWLPITHERGWVYRMKRIGPRTEPRGTPQRMTVGEDSLPSIDTVCVLPERYDLNHARAVPWKPKVCSKRWSSISWSTVSNAADRSRKVSTETLPVSSAVKRPLATFKRPVLV